MSNKKKILIAIDSFKNSISSADAALNLEEGIISASSNIEVFRIPVADGGEGTVEAVIESVGGEYIFKKVTDPLFRKVNARYGLFNNGKSAVIEMASASGLELLEEEERNPMVTTTFGTGELILDAASKGVEDLLIGIGGSATNDGGMGMASALGVGFFDINKNELKPVGMSLNKVNKIDISQINDKIKNINISVICDVTNPLYGFNGASYVYAPQKGANPEDVEYLNNGLINLSEAVENQLSNSSHFYPGSGAAGGLGYGLMVFAGAKLVNGIDFLISFLDLPDKIKKADVVITGEGRMDNQTKFNKTPWGVKKISKQFNKTIIAVAGEIDKDAEDLMKENFDLVYTLIDYADSKDDAIKNVEKYLKFVGSKIVKDLNLI